MRRSALGGLSPLWVEHPLDVLVATESPAPGLRQREARQRVVVRMMEHRGVGVQEKGPVQLPREGGGRCRLHVLPPGLVRGTSPSPSATDPAAASGGRWDVVRGVGVEVGESLLFRFDFCVRWVATQRLRQCASDAGLALHPDGELEQHVRDLVAGLAVGGWRLYARPGSPPRGRCRAGVRPGSARRLRRRPRGRPWRPGPQPRIEDLRARRSGCRLRAR